MSEESISHGEDTENLMYLHRKVESKTYHLAEDYWLKESSSSSDSSRGLQGLKSDPSLQNVIVAKQIGPETIDDPEVLAKTKPFDLLWTYGITSKRGIINLTNENRKEIFFSSCNFPILYNCYTKQMKCLEGHQHLISSLSSDRTGRWLVTADNHKDGYVLIWDRNELKPIYTLFNIYPVSGTILTKISESARYLITIGMKNEHSYSVDFWLWTLGNDEPDGSFELNKSCGTPVEVCFNPNVEEFIMVICKKMVFMLVWDTEEHKIINREVPYITYKEKIGTLTTGTYINNCHECYACSSKGCILIFGNSLYAKPFEEAALNNSKIFVTAVKVSFYAIESCATTANSLVVGDSNGSILFFDNTVKLLYWFTKFRLASVVSISFNKVPKFKKANVLTNTVKPHDNHNFDCGYSDITDEIETIFKKDLPKDASLKEDPFLVPDFFVATSENNIYAIDFLYKKCVPVFEITGDKVSAIEVHDEFPYVLIGYANRRLHLFNYEKNELICSSVLPNTESCTSISCIKYSPESIHLVCGTDSGEVWILEPILMKPKITVPFMPTKNKVMKIVFTMNGMQFAYYDNNKTVILFIYNQNCYKWKFAGKIRCHYEDINDIMFIPHPQKPILYTIGCDRLLVAYNNSDIEEEDFGIISRNRIEQKAIPMSFIYWLEKQEGEIRECFLIADNEHKFKLLNIDTKIPKSVILAPAYGCFRNKIINKMMVIPATLTRYMVFSANKYIGLHIVPMDGNPYKYVGYLGHPSGVVDIVLSTDGKYLFTFGEEDACVFKWKIKTKGVELMQLLGGKELDPFYCLFEGGKNGWMFQEIKDLFYYFQSLQIEKVDLPRRVSDVIKIAELPDLVRTCGFYPSDYELENMLFDIKYRNYQETRTVSTELSFIDFVKLLCNHKPVYGYSKAKLKHAFDTIATNSESLSDDEITREEFADVLSYSGEFMHPSKLLELLKLLTGSDEKGGNFEFLPENITFKILYKEILGIDKGDMKLTKRQGNTGAKKISEDTEV